jgi:hypothetical protein
MPADSLETNACLLTKLKIACQVLGFFLDVTAMREVVDEELDVVT